MRVIRCEKVRVCCSHKLLCCTSFTESTSQPSHISVCDVMTRSSVFSAPYSKCKNAPMVKVFCSLTSTWKTPFSFSRFSRWQLSSLAPLVLEKKMLNASSLPPMLRSPGIYLLVSFVALVSLVPLVALSSLGDRVGFCVRLLPLPLSLVPLVELDVMFESEKLATCVSDLDALLAQVAADDFVCAFHLFLFYFFRVCCRHSLLAFLALPFLGPCNPLLSVFFTGPGVPILGCFLFFSSFFNSSMSDSSMSVSTRSSMQILVSCGGTTILTFICSFVSAVANEPSTALSWIRAPSSLALVGAASRSLCHLLTLCSLPF